MISVANLSLNFRLFSKDTFLEGKNKYWSFLDFHFDIPPQEQVENVLKSIYVNIYISIWIPFYCLHTYSNCFDFSATPLNFSVEHHSVFHFYVPSHQFSLLLLFDVPSEMHRSDYSVILFFTVSSTAFHPAVAFLASPHPSRSYPFPFHLTPLSFSSQHVLFLWLLLLFDDGHTSLYLYEDANFTSKALFVSVLHYFHRSHFHLVLCKISVSIVVSPHSPSSETVSLPGFWTRFWRSNASRILCSSYQSNLKQYDHRPTLRLLEGLHM